MMEDVYFGIDFGTTHVKAAAFSSQGQMLRCLREKTPGHPEGDATVYLPQQVREAILGLITALGREFTPKAIAVTGMSEAGVMLDRRTMEPVGPMLPWFDSRTQTLSQRYQDQDARRFLRTGLHNSFKYGVYKYLWLLEATGRKPEQTLWLSACDYVGWVLTGEAATDPTFAARTYLYDIQRRDWDDGAMAALGLTRNSFPKILETGMPLGYLKNGLLPGKIPVCLCGHDHLCATWFMQAQYPGCICNSMGTAETFTGTRREAPLTAAQWESGLTYGPFLTPGMQYWMANLPAAGLCVEWAWKTLCKQTPDYGALDTLLRETPGTRLLFFPFLNGIGTPVYNAQARGAFFGLSSETGGPELLCSVVEGICLQERYLLSLLPEQALQTPVCIVGGAARCPGWMQRKADILQRTLVCPDISEGTLLGAVLRMCTAEGLPFHPGRPDCRVYAPTDTADPWKKAYAQYCQLLKIFL